ncbi:FAD-dependent monooxygenase [Bosea lathyri]|uniref:2-polyprenyl-6-methoxyphenol hydroxylase n=1 Tax=Bosea lathyri TaxID=1036778 RepID=A0A1H5ZLA6_9HYPH|nr:FAD-dependent monooxygenase [Bosea lathyri]SEG36146.1 2-polyprenyl-6-methoxyphenol hydroxylase [Bosea lathyri]
MGSPSGAPVASATQPCPAASSRTWIESCVPFLSYLALLRTDLVRILHEALPATASLRFGENGCEVDETAAGVRVTLIDGTVLRGDLLIGADGFRSGIRQRHFGPDSAFHEPLGYRFATYPLADTLGLGESFLSYAEPGQMAEYYGLRSGGLAALQIWRDPDDAPVRPEERWPLLKRVANASHPHVTQLIESCETSVTPQVDSLTMIAMPSWHKGRIVLLGDAAHCLTLISGQGAGMAMASAEMLSQELARRSIDEALAEHRRRLSPAIARLQQRSRHMAKVFIPDGRMAFRLRNVVLRYMPRRWLGRYFLNAIKKEIALLQA